MQNTVTERFLRYVAIHTKSDESSTTTPTSAIQFDLARMLADELIAIGCENVRCDDKCYVYAEIPATKGYENKTKLGFIAHMDTAPDFSGEGVKPQIIENYDGESVVLGESGRILSTDTFPHLKNLKGRTLITTNGETLLGADDKAGVAEIVTLADRLISESIPHGKILIGFTPDEEVGSGADNFDVEAFGADYAYTVDGGTEGSLEYENFNAAGARFVINGVNVHPGSAKDIMVNSMLVAMEINALLPGADIPAKTEGYEGFFHLTDMEGTTERSTLDYIVRDHDANMFEARKATLRHIEKVINEKYGAKTVELTIKEQYRTMKEKLLPCMHLIDNAVKAANICGLEAPIDPIRGGTDGARLSFMGLPCPNLGTGGYAGHGPFEHITVEGMEKVVDVLTNIVKIYAE